MSAAVLLALAGLALVDSTSVGTLVLPIMILAQARVSAARVLLYLGTIAVFYWLLGLVLLLGADSLNGALASLDDNRTVDWVQLVIGVGMLVGSFWPDTPWAKRRAAQRVAAGASGRAEGWRSRMGPEAGLGSVVLVALTAGLIEAASMVPYLGAIGLVATSDLPVGAAAGVLAAYVVLMCLPGLLLLGARLIAQGWLAPRLSRFDDWMAGRAGGAVWWILGILGFLLTADAVGRLGLVG